MDFSWSPGSLGTQGVAPRQLPPLRHVVLGGAVLRRLQHLCGTARLADDAVVEKGQVIGHDVELVQPGDYPWPLLFMGILWWFFPGDEKWW